MNIKILLLAISAFTLASCSSTYKNTQTPDDVYYSPARTTQTETRKDEVKRYDPEEREIRMSAYDSRWRTLNDRYNYGYRMSPYDYDYGYNNYNPYNNSYNNSFGNYNGFNNGYHGYNSYGNSGYYYNPYYASYPIYIVTTTTPINRTPRKVNLSGYGQNNTTKPISSINTTNNRYNNSNSANRQYNNSNNNQGKSYTPARNQQPTRTYNPPSNQNNNNNSSGRAPSSNSSSNSSGSSSSGSVERPSRGNN